MADAFEVRDDIDMVTNETFDDLAARWLDEDGDPFEISDARLQLRRTAAAADALLDLTVDAGLNLTGAPDHWIEVIATPEIIQAAEFIGVGSYDLVATRSTDGREERLTFGFGRIRQGVTR